MNRMPLLIGMMAVTVAVASMEGRAQDTGGIKCRFDAAVERESALKAAESAAADKERGAVPERPKNGLVLHYAFGRGGAWGPGAVVKDLSGGGHDGRVEGDGLEVVKGMGPKGRAARFDGKGDFIRVPRDEALEPEEVTVAAWVRVKEGDRSAGEDGIGVLVFKRNSSFHDNEDYCCEIHPNHMPQGEIANPRGMHSRVPAGMAMAPDLWHHVVLTVGGGEIRMYLDGLQTVARQHPYPQNHNTEADLFVGARDHAQYSMGHFGAFDLAELKIWNVRLDGERVAALYRERAGRPGVARPEDNRTPEVQKPISVSVPRTPPRVFSPWEPGNGGDETGLAAELRVLVAQGRRDRAASPEFLRALDSLAERHAGEAAGVPEKPSDRLPLKPEFRGPGMPAGWRAVEPWVWQFGNGTARQVFSQADTRYVLFYEPGMDWTDYEATFRFKSGAWFEPPMRASAVLYFRYRGVDDSYSVWLDGAGDLSLISLDKERRGGQRILARVPLDVSVVRDGKPWTVKVRGEAIEVWHEGKRLLSATDWKHPTGTVGLESVHIPMEFSGVEVK